MTYLRLGFCLLALFLQSVNSGLKSNKACDCLYDFENIGSEKATLSAASGDFPIQGLSLLAKNVRDWSQPVLATSPSSSWSPTPTPALTQSPRSIQS